MGGRYFITGVQLGILIGLAKTTEMQKLLGEIEEKQYICDKEEFDKKYKAMGRSY